MRTSIFALFFLISICVFSQNMWILKPTTTTENITDIDYVGLGVWYASMEAGLILKSTNDGENWQVQTTPVTQHIWSIDFVDMNTGWAVGNDGQIIKTTNGGLNWVIQAIGAYPRFNEVGFLNYSTGFAVGDDGVINKTTNGGAIWFLQMSSTTNDLYGISFSQLSGGGGAIVGANGTILRTTDVGGAWTNISSGTASLYDVIFRSSAGYAVGVEGGNDIIKKSTNAGFSWNTITADFPYMAVDIFFNDESVGWVVGNNGYIAKTTNGGVSWVNQTTFWTQNLWGVRFINQNTGIAVGSAGYVLKTTNGGEPIGIKQISMEIPSDFSLSQNYPNPFNPLTKIHFNIPPLEGGSGRITSLLIYDILGREVSTLVNKQLQPGTYEVSWDGSKFSSGVYFYRLTAGNYSVIKKMMLIK